MKKMLYVLSFIISLNAYATEDAAKKNDILEFIRVTAVNEETLNMIIPLTAQHLIEASGKDVTPEDLVLAAKKQILSDAFLEQFVTPFDEIFSHAEIKTLTQYYKSEEMKKFIKNSQQTYAGLFPAFNTVVQDILNKFPESEASALKKLNDFVVSITKTNYKEEIQDSELPVILDIYSTFCPPCKIVAPIFSELSSEFKGKIKFAKLNVDHEIDLSQELQVRAMPTFLFIKEGKIVDRHVGAIDKEGLLAKIQKNQF